MSPLLLLALTACTGSDPVPAPEPGGLTAGIATARIPSPVGIGTAGNAPFDAPSSSSPFADIYPATKHLHGHPEIKVVTLSRGEGFEVIFVRVDAIGMFQQLRRALVLELQERTGRDFDDALIIGATHTHSGPGRVLDAGGFFDLIADRFLPEFYEAFVDTLADTIEASLADLQPAQVGHVMSTCSEAHDDRRCEDGLDYENPSLPVIGVRRDSEIQAVVMTYAVHGTVLGIDELFLSQDVSGAIEEAVEDRFDHPVEVLMFNAWGADMSPATPVVDTRIGAAQPGGFDKMDAVGEVMADAVADLIGEAIWQDEPVIAATTSRLHIDRDIIGYEDDEFLYEYGGVYCEGGDDCDTSTVEEELDARCIPFNADYPAPNQTVVTAGQIGDLYFVTWPGEAGTLLAESLMDDIQSTHPEVEDIAFFGYTQDYLGYSILEEDWWQGGYEAAGALWGPQQGEHLAFWSWLAFGTYMGTHIMGVEPDPITPFADPVYDPYAVESATTPGIVLLDVAETVGPEDVVQFTVLGEDAWLGTPRAWLETADGDPVLRPNGVPVESDGYRFWIDHAVEPTYEDEDTADARTFAWTYNLPVQKATASAASLVPGSYRLRVEVPRADGSIDDVISGSFTVTGD